MTSKKKKKEPPTEQKEAQRLGRIIIKIVVILFVSGFLVEGCSYLNNKVGIEDDHIMEEMFEHHIHKHTGLDIDLSGDSPE